MSVHLGTLSHWCRSSGKFSPFIYSYHPARSCHSSRNYWRNYNGSNFITVTKSSGDAVALTGVHKAQQTKLNTFIHNTVALKGKVYHMALPLILLHSTFVNVLWRTAIALALTISTVGYIQCVIMFFYFKVTYWWTCWVWQLVTVRVETGFSPLIFDWRNRWIKTLTAHYVCWRRAPWSDANWQWTTRNCQKEKKSGHEFGTQRLTQDQIVGETTITLLRNWGRLVRGTSVRIKKTPVCWAWDSYCRPAAGHSHNIIMIKTTGSGLSSFM